MSFVLKKAIGVSLPNASFKSCKLVSVVENVPFQVQGCAMHDGPQNFSRDPILRLHESPKAFCASIALPDLKLLPSDF